MSNYYVLKNSALFAPLDEKDIGRNENNFNSVYLNGNVFIDNQILINSSDITPRILTLEYPNQATAANIEGGETIVLRGTGFKSNANVRIDNQVVSSRTVISSTQIDFIAPAKSVGNYLLIVENTDGGVGCYVPGINYSQSPSWITPSGNRVTVYETQNIDTTLQVVERDIPNLFEIESGNLPIGVSLQTGTGRISGTAPIVTNSNVYNITAAVRDYQNQKATRNFSLTVNPAPVIWNTPADGASYTNEIGQTFNLTLNASNALSSPITYSANILPSGLSLNNNIISGTFTTAQTRSVLLTASAPAVQKSANRNITITALPPMTASTVGPGLLSSIDNYGTPQTTENSNLWLVPQAIGAQVGDLVFLAYYAGFRNFGEPEVIPGFYGLSSMIARGNFAQIRIGMVVQMKILDSIFPIEIPRGSGSVTHQHFVAQIYRPSRPISNIWVHALNEQTFEDYATHLKNGQSCIQTLDGTGLTNYTRFHIASGNCEDNSLPQLQTSVPTFAINQRNLTQFKGYWPTSNWPMNVTPPAGSYSYVNQGGNFGGPWGQFCLTAYNKGTAGVSQQVISGTNNRFYGLEYSQMSAIVVIE